VGEEFFGEVCEGLTRRLGGHGGIGVGWRRWVEGRYGVHVVGK
jgi:hypothetical protein